MIWARNRQSESAQGFRVALARFPRAIWLRDAQFNLTWVNQAYADAVSQMPEEIIAAQIELLKHSSDADGRALVREAKEKNTAATAMRHVVVGNQRRLLLVTEQPIDHGYFGFALDQTQAEELQSELRRLQTAETQVLQNLSTAVAIFGADQKLKFYNPSFLSLTLLTPPQLDGQPSLTLVMNAMREVGRLPEYSDFRRVRETWQAWFTNLLAPHDELLHLLDGATLHLRVMPHPAGGLFFMLDDITDRLALEAAYNTQIAVQRETIDNLREGTVLLGGDGRVRLWNPAFQTVWNLSDAALQLKPHWQDVGTIIASHFDDGDWEGLRHDLILAPLSHHAVERSLALADGRVLEFAAKPLPDGALLLRFLDVTDKANLTAALRDRADALVAADRLKSEFLYNVSYQLRTPLNTITGFTELLNLPSTGTLNPKQQSYVQDVLGAAESLVALIDNLLVLSSIQAGQIEIQRQQCSIYDLLLEVCSFAETLAHTVGLTITVDADAQLGTAEIDPDRIKQVLLNLISNAVRFAPKDSLITLGARHEIRESQRGLLLFVRDQGGGIPAEDHARIFEPFERTRRKGAGAGLGLSLVRSLIELHQGEINLISGAGKGTEVQCWIPI
jgi:signal transduction histidine kinase